MKFKYHKDINSISPILHMVRMDSPGYNMKRIIQFSENQIQMADTIAKSLGLSFSAFVRLSMNEKIILMMQPEKATQSNNLIAPTITPSSEKGKVTVNNTHSELKNFADFVISAYPQQVSEWSKDAKYPELTQACKKLLEIAGK